MPTNLHKSDTAANAEANALAPLFDGGYLNIYDGLQPPNANTAVTTQRLLASLRFANPAFAAAVGGVLVANPIAPVTAALGGTAVWFRCLSADNATVVIDGSVGATAADLTIPSVTISAGATITVNGFQHTVTK